MRESRLSGSVRGVLSNGHPYRDPFRSGVILTRRRLGRRHAARRTPRRAAVCWRLPRSMTGAGGRRRRRLAG